MDFPFKKAIVTGGAGFIGSHLVEELVKMGVETISIDNYFAGKHENLEHLTGYANFHEIECDVTDPEKPGEVLSRSGRRLPPGGLEENHLPPRSAQGSGN